MKTEREAQARKLAAEMLRQAATALEEDNLDEVDRLINLVPMVLLEGVKDQLRELLERPL